ncbi:MAG: hypothetical protein AB8B93_00420 [Pseudomonadales bacterium]
MNFRRIHHAARLGPWPALIAFSALLASQATYAGSGGHRLDALEPDERSRTAAMVRQRMVSSRSRATRSAQANAPLDDLQLLLVERRPGKDPQAPRLADVFHYDYQQNELVHCVVDVATQEVVRADRQPGVQLPLVQAEIDRAKFILMASPRQRAMINRAYRGISGQRLRSLDDLNYKAFVFHADSTIAGIAQRSAACGTNRCAQILLYTADNVALDLSPIVDLSIGKVTDVLSPQGSGAASGSLPHNDIH